MWKFKISFAVNILLVVTVACFATLYFLDRSHLRGDGATGGTVNPMSKINGAKVTYKLFLKSGNQRDLIIADSDISAAGGEMMVYGADRGEQNTSQLGIDISMMGNNLDSSNAEEIFHYLDIISADFPSKATSLQKIAVFNHAASEALRQIPLGDKTNLY